MTRKSLLPGNATAWERANAEVSAPRMLDAPVATIGKERDPVHCDGAFVAPLGWERSVHFWSPNDDAGNRARVASSFPDHLNYGCPATLEAEIALDTGFAITVREFWELASLVWPDFVVDVAINPGEPSPDLAPVWASALARKPVRDVLASVRLFAAQPPTPLYVGAASAVRPNVKILPDGLPKPPPQLWIGAASRMAPRLKVLPLRT
ncbi:MAG: phage tail protein [Roseiarcus sp.]